MFALPVSTIVNKALSSVSPTARDSILAPGYDVVTRPHNIDDDTLIRQQDIETCAAHVDMCACDENAG